MRVIALWHGGNSYGAPYAEDAEEFPSIAAAEDAMRQREAHGYWQQQTFRYVFRPHESAFTPVAHSEGSGYMDVYRYPPGVDDELMRLMLECGEASMLYRIEYGPRGGIRRERV